MVNTISIFIGSLLISCNLFSQNLPEKKTVKKDTERKRVDSLISKYETEGLKLYNDSMYYAAIDTYFIALHLIDSMYCAQHKFSDAIDSAITQCNIMICYGELNCFKHAFDITQDSYHNWGSPSSIGNFPDRLKVFDYIQFCEGDCYLNMHNPVDANRCYNAGLYNQEVDEKSPDDAIFTYHFGIKSYSLQSINLKMGDCYKAKGDTVKANFYYHRKRVLR